MEFPRFIQSVLVKRLRDFPVVLLVGPRQSGKTTLMRELGKKLGFQYRSFDTIVEQSTAVNDPAGYIKNLKKPVILDEIQRVISLFLPIKEDVDLHPKEKGAYSLTGSANPLVLPSLSDALTGRMAVLHLWPLSQGELLGKKESFLEAVFS
jgi:predicted AAA+ superfamily ATPase